MPLSAIAPTYLQSSLPNLKTIHNKEDKKGRQDMLWTTKQQSAIILNQSSEFYPFFNLKIIRNKENKKQEREDKMHHEARSDNHLFLLKEPSSFFTIP